MKIWILSGPVGSGKTTRLKGWARMQLSARGILSPIADDKRQFLHHPDGESRDMEADTEEREVFVTPRYRFSVAAFRWAECRLQEDARRHPRWLLIDEIGKLELRGQGFAGLLNRLLVSLPAENLVLVIRSELVEAVQKKFGIAAFSWWRE